MNSIETEEEVYSKVGGWLCLDFANTMHSFNLHDPNNDYFKGYNDLILWARQADLISREDEQALKRKGAEAPRSAERFLEKARALREDIHNLFATISIGTEPNGELLGRLNSQLAEAMSHSCIEQTKDGYVWGWSGFPDEMESLLWPILRSMAELLVSNDKLERVRECASETCGWLFIDTSKNHSRRWCDMRDCGNAAKAKRHYHRKVRMAAEAS